MWNVCVCFLPSRARACVPGWTGAAGDDVLLLSVKLWVGDWWVGVNVEPQPLHVVERTMWTTHTSFASVCGFVSDIGGVCGVFSLCALKMV